MPTQIAKGIICFVCIFGIFNSILEIKAEVIPLEIESSDAYASSTLGTASPDLVLDDDYAFPNPTCAHTSPEHTDNGYHWILIDLGIAVSNITMIHIMTNSEPVENSILCSDLTILGAIGLPRIPPVMDPALKSRVGLDWSQFQVCSDSGQVTAGVRRVTIRCESEITARWLAVRRKKPLNFCSILVSVSEIEPNCFSELTTPNKELGVFRKERYVGLNRCRQLCSIEPSCQGNAYTSSGRPHSGICDLLKVSRSGAKLPNCGQGCRMEENMCARGDYRRLFRDGFTGNWKLSSIPQDWYFISIQLNGRMRCPTLNCAPLNVSIIDRNGKKWPCGSFRSSDISILSKTTLTCLEPVQNGIKISVSVDNSLDPASPNSSFTVWGGFARVLPELLTTTMEPPTTTLLTTTRPPTTTALKTEQPTTTNLKTEAPKAVLSKDRDRLKPDDKESISINLNNSKNPETNLNRPKYELKDNSDPASTSDANVPQLWIIIICAVIGTFIIIIVVVIASVKCRKQRKWIPSRKDYERRENCSLMNRRVQYSPSTKARDKNHWKSKSSNIRFLSFVRAEKPCDQLTVSFETDNAYYIKQ